MQLEIICDGRFITCIQVLPNASLRTVLRHTRYAAYDSDMLLMRIGGKNVSIDQLFAEMVNPNKGAIKLHIHERLRGGMRDAVGSFFFRAAEQPSVASQAQTQRTPGFEPEAVETTEGTAMEIRPEQPAAVETADDSGPEQAVGSFFFSAPEQQRERPSQELIAELLGVVPRNYKKQEAKTKGGNQKGKNTQKPKQKATPKVFKWDPRLIFKDGNTLLSTGRNNPASTLGT